jgi:hypothetical protein
MRDIEQLLQCLTGIYIGFDFSNLGLIYFYDCGHVGILSFLGFKRIRTLVEETILDTMGNEVAICMVVMIEVCSELCTPGYGAVIERVLVKEYDLTHARAVESRINSVKNY